jgi:hypothetical protein
VTASTLLVDTPSDAVATTSRSPARRTAVIAFAIALLVPLALFAWEAVHSPINFDGGMNLQVAQRLAHGDGYSRYYDELQTFPHDVQTNGPFLYVAALGITLFGENQFGYQFSNLVYIAGLAAVIFVLLREQHVVVRIVGPLFVLLAVPGIWRYGLGGLGEIPTSFFLFAAVLALAEAVRSPQRAPWWVFGGFAAFGAAFATKTFAQGAVIALATGLLCVLLAAPTRRIRWQVVLAAGGVALVPVARELHRLASLGSVADYRAWWADERRFISRQAGFDRSSDGGFFQTFLDHVHVLSRQVDLPAELLLIALFLPLAWVGGLVLWRWREQGLRRTLTDPTVAVLLMVSALAASYIGWWMLLVPENKLWIRRMIPGLLALHLLYVFLVPWLFRQGRSSLRRRQSEAASALTRWVPAAAAAAAVVLIGVTMLPYAASRVNGNTRALVDGDDAWLDATRRAAAYVDERDGQRFFGDEWWSAPVVSLMSGTDFHNLGDSDFCSLDPNRDRLVWDYDAMTIRSRDPWTRDGALAFDEVAAFGPFVSIYSVGPAPGRCD